MLVHQIETDLYRRQGRALTNFDRTLPAPDSDLARQVLKDPYCVDFRPLAADARPWRHHAERTMAAMVRPSMAPSLGRGPNHRRDPRLWR